MRRGVVARGPAHVQPMAAPTFRRLPMAKKAKKKAKKKGKKAKKRSRR